MSEPLDRPEMTALEASLGKLAPCPAALDRDRLLFEAGRASARPGRLWQGAAAAASLTAAALALLLVLRPAPVTVVEPRVVYVHERPAPQPAPEDPATPPAEVATADDEAPVPQTEYLRRRQEVLRWGVDMLPPPVPGTALSSPLLTPGSLRDYRDEPF